MIDKNYLLEWLKEIDKKLKNEIVVVAIGGTAMTLLRIKSSTIDIDFCVESKRRKELEQALDSRFKIDIYVDGLIFSEQLPADYAEKSKLILKMKKITLKALHPVDIIITKAARFNARDEEDIQALVKYVKKEELVARFERVVESYAGKEEDYRYHFSLLLQRYFS